MGRTVAAAIRAEQSLAQPSGEGRPPRKEQGLTVGPIGSAGPPPGTSGTNPALDRLVALIDQLEST